jgi:hypothetical protein
MRRLMPVSSGVRPLMSVKAAHAWASGPGLDWLGKQARQGPPATAATPAAEQARTRRLQALLVQAAEAYTVLRGQFLSTQSAAEWAAFEADCQQVIAKDCAEELARGDLHGRVVREVYLAVKAQSWLAVVLHYQKMTPTQQRSYNRWLKNLAKQVHDRKAAGTLDEGAEVLA